MLKYRLKEAKIEEWYHGTPTKINSWSTEFLGSGDDQEGFGIYFSSNYEDASGYSRKSDDGVVYTVSLNTDKFLPFSKKPNSKQLLQLIQWADNWEQSLQDIIGEDTVQENWNEFKDVLMDQESMFEACKEVSTHFYSNDPQGYCSSMVSLGYDGIMVKKSFMNTVHAVVWNPKIIKFI